MRQCGERGLRAPSSRPVFVRSVVESLAVAYAGAVATAARLAGHTVDVVHLVGGGSQNTLLCQAVADRTGGRVLAGPVDATAIGNVLVQARATGAVGPDLDDLRELVRSTQTTTEYRPRT